MPRYRFGACLFDSSERELTRNGDEVALSPRAFKALSLLLGRHPNAVSKQELYQELWPDTFVELTNLNNVIAEIRSAIGDAGKSMVKTKHRFGYVFAANLRVEEADADATCVLLIAGKAFPLRQGENVIGRTSDAAIMIASPSISRRHAIVHILGDRAEIEDLRSKNGTTVNDQPVRARQGIPDGATVCFGSVCGIFRALPTGGSTVTDTARATRAG